MGLTEQCTAVIIAYKQFGMLLSSVDWAQQAGLRVFVLANGGSEEVQQYVGTNPDWQARPAAPSLAAAWNAAVREVRTPLVLLLNDDAFVKPHRVEELLRPLVEIPEIAVTGASGGVLRRNMQHQGPTLSDDAHYVEGWCMAFAKKTWEELGGFDERYKPLYSEDADFSLKALRAGRKIKIVPGTCTHVGHSSGAPNSRASEINGFRMRSKYMNGETRTVGIHRQGASGDIIWACHAARSLAATGATVFVSCEAHNRQIVEMSPGIHWGDWPLGFDLDGCYECPEAGGNYTEHPVLRMCREVGAEPLRERYRLEPPAQARAFAAAVMESFRPLFEKVVYVGLRAHCRRASNWSGAKWSQLFNAMPDVGFVLVDHDRTPNVEVRDGLVTPDLHAHNVLDPTGQTPNLASALAVAELCDAAVTVDTVHSSLANAAGLPQVLLLAGIPPEARTHPFGPKCVVVGPSPKPDCWPCGARNGCPSSEEHCLCGVTPDRVKAELTAVLKGDM